MNNPGQPTPPLAEPPRQQVRIPLPHPAERPMVTYIILAVTVIVFLLQWASSQFLGADIPISLGAKVNSAIKAGQFWRLLTPALLHANLVHIGFNMYALYAIGRGLEQHYGHTRYFLLYILSALGGNTLSFLLSPNPSVGASTAIFGLVAAEGVFIFQNKFLFGGNFRPLLANIFAIIVINLLLGLSPGIDNWGHLGGLFGGLGFAWFAGPSLKLEGQYPAFQLKDRHEKDRALPVAAAEALVFILLTFLGLR